MVKVRISKEQYENLLRVLEHARYAIEEGKVTDKLLMAAVRQHDEMRDAELRLEAKRAFE